MTGEHVAEHFRTERRGFSQTSGCSTCAQSLSVNVVYTEQRATALAVQAADSLARDLRGSIHLRAMACVPRQLPIQCPLVSIPFLTSQLHKIVERFDSSTCQYVLHTYVCRSRIDTLLRVLPPSSLVVIGGRRRFWPTSEIRLAKALAAAGHTIVFVDLKAGYRESR